MYTDTITQTVQVFQQRFLLYRRSQFALMLRNAQYNLLLHPYNINRSTELLSTTYVLHKYQYRM